MTQPVGELTRGQRFVRNSYDLARYCARVLRRDRATQMAAALTYRTIFSLIPIAVMGMIVLREFVDKARLKQVLERYVFDYLNARELETNNITVTSVINEMIDKVFELDATSMGGLSVILLIWGAVMLAVTVEHCFNLIYQCEQGRPWHRRLVIYWTVITLGPVMLFFSLYAVEATIAWLEANAGIFSLVLKFLMRFSGLVASFLLLLALYLLMPNTRVQFKPAAIGAFVAAVLFEGGKWLFSLYVSRTVPYSALYGSLGLIPLFLLWVHLTWLMVLFGLELTYTLQTLRRTRLRELERQEQKEVVGDPSWVIPVMVQVGRAFRRGETLDAQELADSLGLPAIAVSRLTDALLRGRFLNRVSISGDSVELSLARPPDRIAVAELMVFADSLRFMQEGRREDAGWSYLRALSEKQKEQAADQTLATLIDQASK